MIKNGKVWGETSLIFSGNNVEVHYITVNPNSFCSKHYHIHRHNVFKVLEGKLKISIHKDYGSEELVDVTILGPGDELTVSPGETHMFESLDEPVKALEVYYVTADSSDIVRKVQGGIRSTNS